MTKSQQTLKKRPAKPYHHGDLRNALIEAGLLVLADQGADALNLREVARRAGVSHTAPYRHFADKEALIAAIAADGFERFQAALDVALAQPARNSRQRLIVLGQTYVRFALENVDHFRVMFSPVRDPQLHPALYALGKRSFHTLIGALQDGQQKGEIVQGDAEEQAKVFWATIHGLVSLFIDKQFPLNPGATEHQSADQLAKRCIETLLAGLDAKPG